VTAIQSEDLGRLRVPLRTALPFLVLPDHRPARLIGRADLASLVKPLLQQQLTLFG
jgi:hypothetical protein